LNTDEVYAQICYRDQLGSAAICRSLVAAHNYSNKFSLNSAY